MKREIWKIKMNVITDNGKSIRWKRKYKKLRSELKSENDTVMTMKIKNNEGKIKNWNWKWKEMWKVTIKY